MRDRLIILEGKMVGVRQDTKDIRIYMFREFAILEAKLYRLMEHQGVRV